MSTLYGYFVFTTKRKLPWAKVVIDSTTITLFSNLLLKGVGRHPKMGKKKGGIKVHTPNGLMEVRIQHVEFVKQKKGGEKIRHKARMITHCDVRKHKLISL